MRAIYPQRVVAVGVKLGEQLNTVTFFRSEDCGMTWVAPEEQEYDYTTEGESGSIRFVGLIGLVGAFSTINHPS
jgi:hypothetical protein